MRDDRPERGAPAGRTHRVYAIEGGPVFLATPRGARGFARVGHFGYGHIDPIVQTGESVAPGQHIGWTCRGDWHVHLSEFIFTSGRPIVVNPLRPGGKLHPYRDTAPPEIREIRFYTPAVAGLDAAADDERRTPAARGDAPRPGSTLRPVDLRVRVSDPQSFIGWFEELPWLAAPHHPFRLAVTIVDVASGRAVRRREAFRAEQVLVQPTGEHFAPGTEQNLPAGGCMQRHATVRCDGVYWFRLFPRYWDTTRLGTGATTSGFARGTWPATSRTPAWSSRSRTGARRSHVGNEAEPPHCTRELETPIALGGVAPRARHLLDAALAARAEGAPGGTGRTGSPGP